MVLCCATFSIGCWFLIPWELSSPPFAYDCVLHLNKIKLSEPLQPEYTCYHYPLRFTIAHEQSTDSAYSHTVWTSFSISPTCNPHPLRILYTPGYKNHHHYPALFHQPPTFTKITKIGEPLFIILDPPIQWDTQTHSSNLAQIRNREQWGEWDKTIAGGVAAGESEFRRCGLRAN